MEMEEDGVDLQTTITQEVGIEELELCPDYQLREKLETWKVEEYEAVFDRLPPVLVARVAGSARGDDRLYLLDGRHRLAAAQGLGRPGLQARIIDTRMLPMRMHWRCARTPRMACR